LQEKNCKLQEVNVLSMTDKAFNSDKPINGNTGSSSTTVVSTRVPGVDMTQVIASPPHLIKENAAKVETKVTAKVRRK
jgi:hypothetical protein